MRYPVKCRRPIFFLFNVQKEKKNMCNGDKRRIVDKTHAYGLTLVIIKLL